jgi:hypothetical protein
MEWATRVVKKYLDLLSFMALCNLLQSPIKIFLKIIKFILSKSFKEYHNIIIRVRMSPIFFPFFLCFLLFPLSHSVKAIITCLMLLFILFILKIFFTEYYLINFFYYVRIPKNSYFSCCGNDYYPDV